MLNDDFILRDYEHIKTKEDITLSNGVISQHFIIFYSSRIVELSITIYNVNTISCYWSSSGYLFQIPAEHLTTLTKRLEFKLKEDNNND